jgi:hypothetical protein
MKHLELISPISHGKQQPIEQSMVFPMVRPESDRPATVYGPPHKKHYPVFRLLNLENKL